YYTNNIIYSFSLHDDLPILSILNYCYPVYYLHLLGKNSKEIPQLKSIHELFKKDFGRLLLFGLLSVIIFGIVGIIAFAIAAVLRDRKSTRLNSSHVKISYAV